MSTRHQLFDSLAHLADEIDGEKQAAEREKSAAPTPADPGGYHGPSSHPTTGTDNNAQEATEGARSSENTADNKADQGSPGVDSTSEATPGQDEQDQQQLNIGTNQSATGEDPAVEDDYKGTKEDSGYESDTSHPAKADKDREKYSSATFKEARDHSVKLANELLADLAAGSTPKRAEHGDKGDKKDEKNEGSDASKDPKSEYGEHMPKPKGKGNSGSHEKESEAQSFYDRLQEVSDAVNGDKQASAEGSYEAGYALAAQLGLDKEAAQKLAASEMEQILQSAMTQADLVGGYLHEKQSQLQSRQSGNGHSKSAMPGEYEEDGEEDKGEYEEGAMEGENHVGGEEVPPEGGPPPEMGGGPPPEMGGEGMMPPGGEEVSEEEALQELAAALDELGQSPEALAGAGPEGEKLAESIQAFKRSGQYQIKAADTKRARHIRNKMKEHLIEVLGS